MKINEDCFVVQNGQNIIGNSCKMLEKCIKLIYMYHFDNIVKISYYLLHLNNDRNKFNFNWIL